MAENVENKKVEKVNKKRKIVWKIDFTKKGVKSRFVWFCILAGLSVIMLIQALVYVIMGIWTANNNFLWFFPTIALLISFFIGRKIILKSQPE